MMLRYVAINLFDSPAQTLVNTVNTVGVMGKGVAQAFKRLYPDMFRAYREFCLAGRLDVGQLYLYKPRYRSRRDPTRGMVIGMATSKVTITLDDDQVAAVRKLVASGKADSVSGFIQHAVSVALVDIAGWGALLGTALEETGGSVTAKERAWADSILKPAAKPKSRRRRKAA